MFDPPRKELPSDPVLVGDPHPGPAGLFVLDRPATLHGPSDSPLVVLVHGALDRATSFSRTMRRLDDLPVLAYDRRGYHRSRDLPVATTVAQHAEDLLALIDGRRSVVVGHSFGGVVALAAVAQGGKSSGIEAVAAYEAPLLWLDWDPTRASTDLLRDVDPADYAEAFFKRVVGSDAWERLPERIRIDRLADGPALVAELAAIRTTIAPFDFAALSVPVLAGRGERSLPHQRRGAELLVERVAHAELFEIPGAGHGAHLTHPDGFASFVRRAVALARHEPPPG